jgi:hypothetical protein
MPVIEFHSFTMGDVEDPEIYAAEPLYKFMQSEKGQWVKTHCRDPRYIIRSDLNTFGTRVIVYGKVEEVSATEYFLKWA